MKKLLLLLFLFLVSSSLYSQNFWGSTNGPSGGSIRSLAINSSGYIFAGTYGSGVFRSTDNGNNWTHPNSGLTDTCVLSLAINNSGYIFAGTRYHGVFRSTDNGNNWIQTNSGLTNMYVNSLVINSGTNSALFAGTHFGRIYRSTNNGNTWSLMRSFTFPNSYSYVSSFAINNSGHIFAGDSYYFAVYRSTDNGNSWTQLAQTVNSAFTNTHVFSLAINSNDYIFAGTESDGVFRSTDNGNNWTQINNGLTDNYVPSLAINNIGYIFAGAYGGEIFRSVATTTYVPNIPQLAVPLDNAINQPVNISLVWNNIQNATSYKLQLATDSFFANIIVNDSTITDTLRLVSSLSNNVTYYWKVLAKNVASPSNWSAIRKFTTIVQLPSQIILVSPVNGSTVTADSIACIWNQSTPGILNYWFERATDSLFTLNRIVDSTHIDTVIITKHLTNGNKFWWRVRARNITGYGEFSAKRFFNAIITSVADQLNMPHVFALDQNYPNPFNPTTTFSFSLPSTSFVSLKVFDALGREVATLVNEELSAGDHSRQWNAANMSSGFYFYRLQSGSFTETKKLVLLR